MAGTEKEGTPDDRWKWNGGKTERITDLGLNWDETHYRSYDMQLGRFWQVDPLPDHEGQEELTPYQFGYNNPILHIDLLGDAPDGDGPGLLERAANVAVGFSVAMTHNLTGYNQRHNTSYSDAGSYNLGQDLGDATSTVLGAVETGLAALGLAGEGIAEVGSGGLATPVVVAAGAGTLALGAHGLNTAGSGWNNLINKNGRVNAHGNSKSSNNVQHRYTIRDKNGKIVDSGISGQKLNKNGTSPRANQKLNTKFKDRTDLKAKIEQKNIGPKNGKTSRQNALNKEQGGVNAYSNSKKNPQPGKGPAEQNKPQPNQ